MTENSVVTLAAEGFMRNAVAVALVALLGACASSTSTPPRPTSCNRTDRHGTYLFEFKAVSGDCGDLPSSLVNLDAPDTSGCTPNSESQWSEGDCKLSVDQNCKAKPTGTIHIVEVTHQETQDGAHLSGTVTATISGSGSDCVGTYSVSATRQ